MRRLQRLLLDNRVQLPKCSSMAPSPEHSSSAARGTLAFRIHLQVVELLVKVLFLMHLPGNSAHAPYLLNLGQEIHGSPLRFSITKWRRRKHISSLSLESGKKQEIHGDA